MELSKGTIGGINIKKWMTGIGIAGALTGLAANKLLTNYGMNGRLIVGICSIVILLIVILYLSLKKNKLAAIIMIIMTAPIALGVLGIYLYNIYSSW